MHSFADSEIDAADFHTAVSAQLMNNDPNARLPLSKLKGAAKQTPATASDYGGSVSNMGGMVN